MLELRLAATSLELDWVTEKLGPKINNQRGNRTTHRIALMRHEMTNFLRNLAGYVAAQVTLGPDTYNSALPVFSPM